MAAYDSHLRKIHNNEAFYGGSKPKQKPFITDRDIVDAHHKFLRDNDPDEKTDPLVKEYYESLIKDCVLVDLSRYKEKQVAMRWRTIDEVKAGKGEKICADITCGRTEDLEGMEVVFNYAEDGKAKNVLVKCVLCQRCGKKMHRVRDKGRERKRSESGERHSQDKEKHKESRHHNRGEHGSSRHRETKRRRKDGPDDKSERHTRRPAIESPESKSTGGEV